MKASKAERVWLACLACVLGACQVLPPPVPAEQAPATVPVSLAAAPTESLKIRYQASAQAERFGVQAVDLSELAFLRATLVGELISGQIQSELVPVSEGHVSLTLENIPREQGRLRVITVQGYAADQRPLAAFVAAGYYRSASQQANVEVAVNRRQLIPALALKELLQTQTELSFSLDLQTLQQAVDQATGFAADTRSFELDPTLFRPSVLANLLKTGQMPTSEQILAQARAVPSQPSLSLRTLRGGDFAESVRFSINDPLSQTLSFAAGTESPVQISGLQIPPGSWQARLSRSDGSLLDTATVTVNSQGELSLSQDELVAEVTETPVLSGLSLTEAWVGDTLNLTGRGFSLEPSENQVYVGESLATVLTASPTNLSVAVPLAAVGSQAVSLQVAGQQTQAQPVNLRLSLRESTALAGSESGYANGPLGVGRLSFPRAMVHDGQGNLYVADRSNHRIRKISPDGVLSSFAGNGNPGFLNGERNSAEFHTPSGLVFDSQGNLYVSDDNNNRIRKISPDGMVTTFAGSGAAGDLDGTGTEAQLVGPGYLTIDREDHLYVVTRTGRNIRKISPDAVVSTLAGHTNLAGYQDGEGSVARFNNLQALVVDSQGYLYAADRNNHRIRKISPTGFVTTLAGNSFDTDVDGLGSAAGFDRPTVLAITPDDRLYTMGFGGKIREISQAGQVTTLFGPAPHAQLLGDYPLTIAAPISMTIDPASHAIFAVLQLVMPPPPLPIGNYVYRFAY